jgi:hypothetical protein
VSHPEPTPDSLDEGFFDAAALLLVPPRRVCGLRAGIRLIHAGVPGGPWRVLFADGYTPLGIVDLSAYGEQEDTLAAGEFLLTASDGVHEARRASDGAFFAAAALPGLLQGLPAGAGLPQVFAALWAALAGHAGDEWPQDDATLLGYG